jgi:hypothetical protein
MTGVQTGAARPAPLATQIFWSRNGVGTCPFGVLCHEYRRSKRRLVRVTFAPGDSIDVGAIVNAKGFGNEQCRIEYPAGTLRYEGQPFWGPDKFATLDPNKHKVLISGAGDGALQDYLRIVIGLGRAIGIVRQCNMYFTGHPKRRG